jgi:hypothetical protein
VCKFPLIVQMEAIMQIVKGVPTVISRPLGDDELTADEVAIELLEKITRRHSWADEVVSPFAVRQRKEREPKGGS